MSINRVPALEIQQFQLQEEELDDWRRIAVNRILSAVRQRVEVDLSLAPRLAANLQGQNELVYNLSREVAFSISNAVMSELIDTDLQHSAKAYTLYIRKLAEDAAEEAFNHWWDNRNTYEKPEEMPRHKDYVQYVQGIQRIDPAERPNDHVPAIQKILLDLNKSDKREHFHRVRGAEYRAMRPDDATRIAASYNSALLTEKDLELLLVPTVEQGENAIARTVAISNQIDAFRKRLAHGVFINKMDAEDLRQDLEGKCQEETGMPFYGRVLEHNDEILAWVTSMHAPKGMKVHQRHVQQYLRRGVTGGKLNYAEGIDSARMWEHSDAIELFQDIRSHVPFGSDRLASLLFREMGNGNDRLKYVLAYRLYDMDIQPDLPLQKAFREVSFLTPHNDKSWMKFVSWGFKHIGIDARSGKHAPKVKRGKVGQYNDVTITPRWGVMGNTFPDVVNKTSSQWQNIQNSYGDISHDNAPISWEPFRK